MDLMHSWILVLIIFSSLDDPKFCSNMQDTHGRYIFANQPQVALWNLSKLGRTFTDLMALPLDSKDLPIPKVQEGYTISGANIVEKMLLEFDEEFNSHYAALMRKKLGLSTERDTDQAILINPLLQIMTDCRVDYTNFWRALCYLPSINPVSDTTSFSFSKKARSINHLKETCLPNCRTMLIDALDNQFRDEELFDNDFEFGELQQKEKLGDQSGTKSSLASKGSADEIVTIFKQFVNKDIEILPQDDIDDRWDAWVALYRERIQIEGVMEGTRVYQMRKANPKYTLRNWLLFEVGELVQKEIMYGGAENQGGLILERTLRIIVEDAFGVLSDQDPPGFGEESDSTFAVKCSEDGPSDMIDISIKAN
jgi:uncharacterized protein YdiU (UPF0061 family)